MPAECLEVPYSGDQTFSLAIQPTQEAVALGADLSVH